MIKHGSWKTLSTSTPFETPWIQIQHNDVITPAGKPGKYTVVHLKSIAIGIIAIDSTGHIWLVKQYRYPLKQYTWEIPEGGGSFDKPTLESAQRELKEECGLIASEWIKLMDIQLSNSNTDEIGEIYLATGLIEQESEPEETEDIECMKIPLEQFYDMVDRGEIQDSLTMLAAFKLKIMQLEGKLVF